MRVADLLEILADMPEDAEIRIASQPNWPFEHAISGVGLANPKPYPSKEEFDEMTEEQQEQLDEACNRGEYQDWCAGESEWPESGVVYIGEGTQIGYLPACGSVAVGWRR